MGNVRLTVATVVSSVALLSLLTFAAACGDSGEQVKPAQPVQGSSSNGSSGAASGSSSGGSSGASSSGASTSSSGSPSTGPCPTPTADTKCTLPDGENLRVEDSWVMTDASCKTSIYVNVSANSVGQKLRRYTLKTLEPCVLERDVGIGDVTALGKIASDDAGNVFAATSAGVARVHPGARVDCTNAGFDFTDLIEQALVMSPDGTTGYVAYSKFMSGGAQIDWKIAKVTANATSCSIAPFPLTGVTLAGAEAVAIDGKGRVHIADDRPGPDGNERVVIVDANGAFVSEYDKKSGGTKIMAAVGLSRSRTGIFLDTFFETVSVTDDGAFISEGKTYTPPEGISFPNYRTNARGPLFFIGTRYGDPPAISISVLKDR